MALLAGILVSSARADEVTKEAADKLTAAQARLDRLRATLATIDAEVAADVKKLAAAQARAQRTPNPRNFKMVQSAAARLANATERQGWQQRTVAAEQDEVAKAAEWAALAAAMARSR